MPKVNWVVKFTRSKHKIIVNNNIRYVSLVIGHLALVWSGAISPQEFNFFHKCHQMPPVWPGAAAAANINSWSRRRSLKIHFFFFSEKVEIFRLLCHFHPLLSRTGLSLSRISRTLSRFFQNGTKFSTAQNGFSDKCTRVLADDGGCKPSSN